MKLRLTDEGRRLAEASIVAAQAAWGLRDWEIGLRIVPYAKVAEEQGKNCLATVHYDDRPCVATISLVGDCPLEPGQTFYPLATLMAHEVGHILCGPLQDSAEKPISWMSTDDRRSYGEAFQAHLEMLLDTIAMGLTGMRAVIAWEVGDLPFGWEDTEEVS